MYHCFCQPIPFAQSSPRTAKLAKRLPGRFWLTQLGVNLIVPMSGADGRMAGLLLHRGFYFLAHKPRKLGHRIQLFDLLDQVEQDLLLAVVR